jgi:pimeloyl-ACP methyl ester carboxylesterase
VQDSSAPTPPEDSNAAASLVRRHYVRGPYGEIHIRSMRNAGSGGRPLMCLHPAPYSGLYFETLMPLLTKPSLIIAPDYPGYGGSRRPEEQLEITDYAATMLSVAGAVKEQPIDLLGFHTGSLVALEMAAQQPETIGRIILIDVPYLAPAERESMRQSAALPPGYTADLECLSKSFSFNISDRMNQMGFDRAFELFVEQLRPGNGSNQGFHAAFSYDIDKVFARISNAGRIIATKSGLLDGTRMAAKQLPTLEFSERLDITRSVFEESVDSIAGDINDYLGADQSSI